MTSAPRSARTWVPKGPAPNWETARIRTPSSGGRRLADTEGEPGSVMSVGQLALTQRGMVLLRDEDMARIGTHLVPSLVGGNGLDGHDPAIAALGLPQRVHRAARIERIADEREQ